MLRYNGVEIEDTFAEMLPLRDDITRKFPATPLFLSWLKIFDMRTIKTCYF